MNRAQEYSWLVLLFIGMARSSSASTLTENDAQSWMQLNLTTHRYQRWSAATYLESRIYDDLSRPGLYLLSEKLGYRVSPNWAFGANYTYIQFRMAGASGDQEFRFQHRAEFEVNPRWRSPRGWELALRNRLELRWIERRPEVNIRSRHRLQFSLPIHSVRWLDSAYANNEFFHDYRLQDHPENRLTPVGLKFRLGDNTALRAFYLIQSVKRTHWTNNHVVGTNLTFTF